MSSNSSTHHCRCISIGNESWACNARSTTWDFTLCHLYFYLLSALGTLLIMVLWGNGFVLTVTTQFSSCRRMFRTCANWRWMNPKGHALLCLGGVNEQSGYSSISSKFTACSHPNGNFGIICRIPCLTIEVAGKFSWWCGRQRQAWLGGWWCHPWLESDKRWPYSCISTLQWCVEWIGSSKFIPDMWNLVIRVIASLAR